MIEYIPGLAGVPATESSISSIDGENGIFTHFYALVTVVLILLNAL
jgi:citrate synthase